jgi:hypothetical protein
VIERLKQDLNYVRRDGHALRYVKYQTDKICFEAIKQTEYALRIRCVLMQLESMDML